MIPFHPPGLRRAPLPLLFLLFGLWAFPHPAALAEGRPQSVARLETLLNEEYDALERDKKALDMDCGIVSSRDTAKIAQCQARRDELSRRIRKYNADSDAFEARKARLEMAESRLAALDRRIASTRSLLAAYTDRARINDYQRSLDEWTSLAEEARQKARSAAVEGVLDVVIESSLVPTERKMDLTREAVEKLTGTSCQRFLSDLERHASRVLAQRLSIDFNALSDRQAVLRVLSILKNGFSGASHLKEPGYDDYLTVCLKFLAIANAALVSSPTVGALLADAEILPAAAYGWVATGFARERLQQLLSVREEEFKGISQVTTMYVKDIKDRDKLHREVDGILAEAGKR